LFLSINIHLIKRFSPFFFNMLQIETIAFVYSFVIFHIFFIFPLLFLIYFCFTVISFLFILRIIVSESRASPRVIRIYKDILFIAKVCTT